MKYLFRIIILVSLSICIDCYANDDLSSYKKRVSNQSENEADENTYKWLINYYLDINIDSSEYYARLALDRFKEKENQPELAFAYTSLAQVLFRQRELEESQNNIIKAINLSKDLDDFPRLAIAYHLLGNIQSELHNDKDALYYYNKAEHLFDSTNHTEKGSFYADLAAFYWSKDSLNVAKKHFQKAFSEYQVNDVKIGEIHCLKSIGGVYHDLGQLDSFLIMINKSIDMAKEAYNGMPNTHELTGYQNLAVYYYNKEDYDKVSFYLEKFIEGNQAIGNKAKLVEGYDFLSEVNYLIGNYDRAYDHLVISKDLRDSLVAASNDKEIVRIQRKYNYEIEERKRINAELEAARANEERIIYLFIMLASLLVIVTLALLYRARVLQNKKELVIKEQRINELLKEQEIQSLNSMMEGQEQERKRVAKDLHDRLGVMLSTIKLNISALEGRVDQIREENQTHYKHTQSLIDDAVEEVRRISRNLVSGVLAKFGLVPALEDLTRNISISGQIKCEVIVSHMEERLSGNQEIAIYRMIQECIGNALKHSKAKNIIVQLIRHDEELTVMVEDDGVGFNMTEVQAKGKGMGLDNIRSRITNLGGQCTFDTNPGQGTTIIAEIPIKTNTHE